MIKIGSFFIYFTWFLQLLEFCTSSISPIRVGFRGTGSSMRGFHGPFLTTNPNFRLVSFLRTKNFSVKGFEEVAVFTNESYFYKSVDLVIITTPPEKHYEHIRSALKAKKHVVVDQPFTVTYKQSLALERVAKNNGVHLVVYNDRIYDGEFKMVENVIKDHKLGSVVVFESNLDVSERKDFGASGFVYDVGYQMIHQAITLFGVPNKITAIVKSFIDTYEYTKDSHDYFSITMHYEATDERPKDLLCVLKASKVPQLMQSPRFLVHGTKGSFGTNGRFAYLLTSYRGDKQFHKVKIEEGNQGEFYDKLEKVINYGNEIEYKISLVVKLIEQALISGEKEMTVEIKDYY